MSPADATTPAEHTLAAVTALSRARQALDQLWLDCRCTAPSQQELDALVFAVVFEIVTAQEALEHVTEAQLQGLVGYDPQRMNVADWSPQEEARHDD